MKSLAIVIGNPHVIAAAILNATLICTIFSYGTLWHITFEQIVWNNSLIKGASINAFLMIGFGVGTPLVGWFSDRCGTRKGPAVFGPLIAGIALVLVLQIPMPLWLAETCLLICGMACGVSVICFALACENTPESVHGLAIAVINMIGFVSVTLMNLIPTWICTFVGDLQSPENLKLALMTFVLVLFVGFITSTFFIRETGCKSQVEIGIASEQ